MGFIPDQIESIANFDIKIRHKAGVDILVMKLKTGVVKLSIFPVERLNKENINTIIHQYRALAEPSIILAPHISAEIAKQLHGNNVQFIDLSGNIFIDSSAYIFIKGEKRIKPKTALASPFSAAGIKLVFALLSNPGLENQPYRTIAKASQISLGSIDTLIRSLKHHHFLIEVKDHKRKLINKAELLKRWCIAFAERLSSKIILSRLSCDNKQWWNEVKLEPKTALWGGEVAAAMLTKYLKPQTVSIYAEYTLPALQAKYALRKSDHGEIIIYKKFWNFPSNLNQHLVPVLLIYAELINSGESRNAETARMIYEKHLSKIIE